MTAWHCQTAAQTLAALQTDPRGGLDAGQVRKLQAEQGANELIDSGGRGAGRILWEQLSSAMVLLLIVAAAASALLGEITDTLVIVAIVVINAALGFVQDYRAERALAALKKLAVPQVRVRRQGTICEISARQLVPGDLVLLEVGNFVPADGRLIESVNLKIDEAALTGESEAVPKHTRPLADAELPLGDRTNMVYMGTVVTYGHGQAVITATGMRTELGQIAKSMQGVETEATPLQKRLAQLGRSLAQIALLIVGVVFVFGLLRGEDPRLMLMTALSLAVAVVPEGLPAVATVALALGARRLFQRNALIRKLPAVETLGSVTVICSDKTGTLTENRMTVTVLDVAGEQIELDAAEQWQFVGKNDALTLLLAGAGLCNDARLQTDLEDGDVRAIGDPTEAALVVATARLGVSPPQLRQMLPRVGEVPFDSDRKRMTTVHRLELPAEGATAAQPSLAAGSQALARLLQRLDCQQIAFTKGAVDSLVSACSYVWDGGQQLPMDAEHRQRIAAANSRLAGSGMRVLGVAFRPLRDQPADASCELEHDLVFVGLLGMIDPPREEVAEAVSRCRAAGIRPVMITGDHPLTAQHIAAQLKISENGSVLTGKQLEEINQADLTETAKSTAVYARVSPKHKLRLVQALQADGQVVAMTGDGVNDAPALKQAHIGVAMGITGTDVSKEASQMVLLDDNFATIVGAVEQGRIVYDNIRKFVKYTMTSNAGEIWVMILGPLLGMPFPLLPLQILWVNLVTDGLPGLALAVERAERNTMQRAPYPPDQHIFAAGMGRDIAWIGLLMALVSLALGYADWATGGEERHWRTLVFTVLTMSQMGNALATRSSYDSIFRIGWFSNPALIASVLLTLALQMAVIYWLPLQSLFKTAPLSLTELAACLAISTSVFWMIELHKWIKRLRQSHRPRPT